MAFTGAMAMVAGIGTIAWGIQRLVAGDKMKAWPIVDGVVEESRVVEVTSSSSEDRTSTWAPSVVYAYTAGGTRHRGNRLASAPFSSTRSWAEGVVGRYPPGREVPVFVDPGDPTQAVLEPGAGAGGGMLVGIGLMFLVIGLVFFFLF